MGNTKSDSEKKLSLILVGLCVVVVGLIIAIIIVASTTMGNDYRQIGEEMVNCGKLDELESPADVSNCLADLYNEVGEEKTLSEYREKMDSAFEKGDYDMFYGLLLGRASFYYYILEKDCEVVTSSLDDDRVVAISPLQRLDYYQSAVSICSECNDVVKMNSFEQKIDQLYLEDNNEELFEGSYE